MVQKGSGNFEVVEGGAPIVTGRIYVPEDIEAECVDLPPLEDKQTDTQLLPLTGKDIYKELRLRGYNYKGLFRGITYANNEGKYEYFQNHVFRRVIQKTNHCVCIAREVVGVVLPCQQTSAS